MDKKALLDLIARINTKDESFAVSTETTRWKALREAEALTDAALFPQLMEMIDEHEGKDKKKRDVRDAAYFILGRLLETSFDKAAASFFIQRLKKENDKHILDSMLNRITDWQRSAKIMLPADVDISPILSLAKDERRRVRHSAIHALGTCPGSESRKVLAHYLTQADEKTWQYEMYYANIALQTIGEPADIPLLERFLKSRRPDLKLTAQYAIAYIKERSKAAPSDGSHNV